MPASFFSYTPVVTDVIAVDKSTCLASYPQVYYETVCLRDTIISKPILIRWGFWWSQLLVDVAIGECVTACGYL